jgi:hypothetical protein
MAHESAYVGSTGNAGNSLEGPSQRSCKYLVRPCKSAGATCTVRQIPPDHQELERLWEFRPQDIAVGLASIWIVPDLFIGLVLS